VLTTFNFSTISIIIVFVSTFRLAPVLTTIFSQIIGLILSMWFTLDYWWKRSEFRTEFKSKSSDRFYFLSIGSISAALSALATQSILGSGVSKTLELLIVNWSVLAMVAIIKFILLASRYLKNLH
jgi:hypothetical protein